MAPSVQDAPPPVRTRAAAPATFRASVVDALQTLGQGLLDHPANTRLRDRLRTGALPLQSFHDQLLLTAFRLAFLHLAQRPTPKGPPLLTTPAPTARNHWRRFATRARALSTLRGFLWSPQAAPDLLPAPAAKLARSKPPAPELADAAFLHASDLLARIQSADDLAVYEALLALKPQLSPDAARFSYAAAPGAARKSAGAYYTPDALVQSLLDSALDPAVAQALARKPAKAAPAAILALRVGDPACGSGRFLVAAARRLALHLARARGKPDDPNARRRALRDVLRRCIHGVDLDPVAVELCKITLWLELAEPGEPLTFLDDRIKCGNALLGADHDLLAAGIPDDAFTTRPGDHPKAVAYFKRRNKLERAQHANTPANKPAKIPLKNPALAADAWCAAFLWRKHDADKPGAVAGLPGAWDAVTERTLRRLQHNPASVPARVRNEVRRLAELHRFFHWPLAFPDVFSRRGGGGGFDVILGNPPFLNQLETATVTDRGLAAILAARTGGTCRGYTDLSATFLVLAASLARPGGRVALVQPQSLLAAKDAAPVRAAVLRAGSLSALWVANAYLFEGVSVFTCAPTIHVAGPRSGPLARSTGPAFTPLPPITVDADALAREETWAHLAAAASGVPDIHHRAAGRLGDLAHATADFRDQYYGLSGFLVEDADLAPADRDDARFPPIVTSGLIDPAHCRWGAAHTRILKRRWLAPRVDRARMLASGALGPWLASRLVPKLLLATQTRILEVFADEHGRFVPSTPLITITPRDPTNPANLWRLAAALASPVLTALALKKFAGAALNADAIKLSAKQVLDLPLPADRPAWDLAADQFRAASARTDPRERARALHEFGRLACRAYGLAEPHELLAWWTDRLAGRSPARRSVAIDARG